MTVGTADLAKAITRTSSKQSYMTARLLVDKDLVDDCYRAYGYFRWVDDVVDTPTMGDMGSQCRDECISFITRQGRLIHRLYRSECPKDLSPEEEMIADLIRHDRGENSRLQSFIRNFLAIIEFDAHRRGRLISQRELTWYSDCLGKAVTDAIQYFIGNGHPYPKAHTHYLAATGAHITHMLRDMAEDTAEGYFNVPREYLEEHDIGPEDVESPAMRDWVSSRVQLARHCFLDGKRYIDRLDVLRCKLAAHWYCARFEGLLDVIESDGYVLRAKYGRQNRLFTGLRLAWLALSLTVGHIARRGLRTSREGGLKREVEGRDHTATGEAL